MDGLQAGIMVPLCQEGRGLREGEGPQGTELLNCGAGLQPGLCGSKSLLLQCTLRPLVHSHYSLRSLAILPEEGKTERYAFQCSVSLSQIPDTQDAHFHEIRNL